MMNKRANFKLIYFDLAHMELPNGLGCFQVEITITMFKEMFVLDARSDSDALWQLAEEASFNHFLDFLANVFGKLKSLAFFYFLKSRRNIFHSLSLLCW